MGRSLIIVAALVVILFLCVTWVGGGQVVVRESMGGAAAVLAPGVHLRVPLYHRLYRYDTGPVTLDEAMPIVTHDNATFKLSCRIAAHVSPGDALTFHKASSGRDTVPFIQETVRGAIREAAKGMNSDQILMPGAGAALAQRVSADLIGRGISDDGLKLGAPGAQVVFNAVVDYINRQLPASARQLAEAAIKADPREALNQAAMGAVFEAEGKTAEAESRYQEALYLDPTAPEPMSRLYLMYQTSKDPAALGRLQRLLEASIAKKKDSPMHHDWLGQVYLRTGQLDKAELAFNTAIALAPKSAEFHVSLGSLRVRQGRLEDARAAYGDALAIRPDMPLALYNIGITWALQGDLDKAIASFEKAEKAGPANVALLNSMAQAYEQKGDTAKAVGALRRSLAQRPDQPERAADLKRLEAKLKAKK
jgi:tetratricopeptide (TPR) repeat protein